MFLFFHKTNISIKPSSSGVYFIHLKTQGTKCKFLSNPTTYVKYRLKLSGDFLNCVVYNLKKMYLE